jgi:hypothetical protein
VAVTVAGRKQPRTATRATNFIGLSISNSTKWIVIKIVIVN